MTYKLWNNISREDIKSVDSKCDIDSDRPDIAMKLHYYAINSAHEDRLYSGNNCLESIKKQNHIIDGHERDTYNPFPYLGLSADPDLNRKSFSNTSFYHNKPYFCTIPQLEC